MRFADLGVREEIVRALAEQGIENAFAIQELTLPLALAGDDLIGQARTGMGKTFAFGVPLLHSITTGAAADRPLDGTPRALIVVPTRELCMQVHDDLAGAAKYLRTDGGRPLSVISIYGGRPYESQIESLQAGADVVVGTPGRLLDLAQQGHLRLGGLSVLVLDEADEMLDLGFLPDIERILRQIPAQRQAMLFSATMPDPIITLARTFMTQPTHIRAEGVQGSATHDTTAQKVSDELAERGFKVGAVHGDLGQIAREKSLKAFRTGEIDVLVATDVAARGIDIDDVTHVINYQIPEDEQAYVHRIGRTGRAGKTGVAVTLIDWDELERWSMINTALKLDRPDPAETYSNSPHFYEELGIPADAVGTIGGARKSSSPRPSRGDNRGDNRGDTRSETRGETRVSSTDRARSGSGDASRPSRNRSRQRTRSGENSSGHVENSSAAAASANPESSAAAGEGAARRRRRRRPRNAAEAGATPN